jgi:hypothetical protein
LTSLTLHGNKIITTDGTKSHIHRLN